MLHVYNNFILMFVKQKVQFFYLCILLLLYKAGLAYSLIYIFQGFARYLLCMCII